MRILARARWPIRHAVRVLVRALTIHSRGTRLSPIFNRSFGARVPLTQALDLMAEDEYQPVENAFREGTIGDQDPATLRRFLLALSNKPIPNDTVRHRDIIRGLTINHLLLHDHITRLNQQNSRTQKWVIALALAALVSSVVQIFSPLLFKQQGQCVAPTLHAAAVPPPSPPAAKPK